MADIGAFTPGTARLSRWDGPTYSDNGQPQELTAVFTVLLACGTLATPTSVSGLPSINATHGTLTSLRVHTYDFAMLSDNKSGYDFWEIRVTYRPGQADETGEFGSSRLTMAEWDTHDWEQDLVYDIEEELPFATRSGGTFDSAPQIQKHGRIVRFTRLQSAHPADMVALTGSVNASSVTCLGCTFAPRTAKVRVSGRDTFATSGLRYEVTVEILERNNECTYGLVDVPDDIGWDVAVLEADYYYLDDDYNRVRFMEKEELDEDAESQDYKLRPSASPQLLTVLGKDGRGGDPIFMRWHTAKGESWSALRLPS